jgi:hypothetical protein
MLNAPHAHSVDFIRAHNHCDHCAGIGGGAHRPSAIAGTGMLHMRKTVCRSHNLVIA